jgi:hypothetical protein
LSLLSPLMLLLPVPSTWLPMLPHKNQLVMNLDGKRHLALTELGWRLFISLW